MPVFASAASFLESSPSLEDVDREIQFHTDFIKAIQAYRNARLVNISRLPDDILSTIFEDLALSSYTYHPKPSYSTTWLPVTQVCRGWRDIALVTPRMWSCIYDQSRPEFVELLLQRSGSVPLHLRTGGKLEYPKDNILMLSRQHANRLREIDLRHPFDQLPQTLINFLLWPPLISNLRTLKLEGPRQREPIATRDMLLALGNMDQLETLELIDVLHPSRTILQEDTTAVLPHLRRVLIRTAFLIVLQAIITRITCPNVQTIHAATSYECVVEPDVLAPVASVFYSLIPNPSSTWRTRLTSYPPTYSPCPIRMQIWPASGVALPKNPPFEVSIYGPSNFQSHRTLCSTLPIGGPSELRLERSFSSAAVLQLLQVLDSVDSVQEVSLCNADIFSILAVAPEALRENGRLPSLSLPSLKHLSWTPNKSTFEKQDLDVLERMLGARRAVGAGIEKLTIYNDDLKLSEADVAPLWSHVRNLRLVED